MASGTIEEFKNAGLIEGKDYIILTEKELLEEAIQNKKNKISELQKELEELLVDKK